jgi:uroporphyrinogen decarboxylase
MNSRQRIRTALAHQEPDRVPLDLGATVLTGIHVTAYERLRDHLGMPHRGDIQTLDVLQQLAVVDEDMRQRLKVDVRDIAPRSSATFQVEIRDGGDYTYFYDEWGIGWRRPKIGGLYYDMFDNPLRAAQSFADIDAHPWPDPVDPARFAGLGERAKNAAELEGQGVVLGGLCGGILEMAAWLRGFESYFIDLAVNQRLLGYLMDKVLELKLAYWEKALAEVGVYADVVQEADDFAGQLGMLISPATYRALVKPRHNKLFQVLHARSQASIFFHSCGAIRPVIPDLIDIGLDILNPVQVSAAGMDSAALKRDFGRSLTFWGGGVDTQRVLGNGTPQQVREDVKRRIEDLAPGGGFVFATVHNIQPNVPPENILAMWETLQQYGAYPISAPERA